MMARFAILQVLLRAGGDFVKIVQGEASQSGGKGTHISLDRTKLHAIGVPAIRDFLVKLQVYKSTGGLFIFHSWCFVLGGIDECDDFVTTWTVLMVGAGG
jgi:hypothetical protein